MARYDCVAVYMMASRRNGTVYLGVTSDLQDRVGEQKFGSRPGFAKRYGCNQLVWFELHGDMAVTIQRETSLKRYNRVWKLRLIEGENPEWNDLAADWWS